MKKACSRVRKMLGGIETEAGHQSVNWSGRSGSAHSADLCFIGNVFFWVDRGGLRPAARAALARILQ